MSKSIKYSKFRVVVKNLINDLYNRTEISKSEMMDFESRFIEYAVDCNYDIYVRVACYDLSDYFELTSEDLLRFVEKPRARIKIERLRLYTMVNDAFSKRYYEIGEPDENGIFHDYPEVLKTSCVSTKRFLIKEEDLSLLKEAVDDGWWWLVVVGGGWWWWVVVGGGWWWLVVAAAQTRSTNPVLRAGEIKNRTH